MTPIRWNLGPDELDCIIEVAIEDGEPERRFDWNSEGYPGSGAWVEILEWFVVEGGKRRAPNEQEEEWFEADSDAIRERALELDAVGA